MRLRRIFLPILAACLLAWVVPVPLPGDAQDGMPTPVAPPLPTVMPPPDMMVPDASPPPTLNPALVGTPLPFPTIIATPAPSAVPTFDMTQMVARVPFAETFDTNWGWQPEGAWQYAPDGGYSGGGWQLDGAQRETLSTLTYASSIDLSGVLNAQLMFRQDGVLPTSDFVVVEVSLDGGRTWLIANIQIGVEAAWALHTVDLTAYRGQVVRLRFRVQTGVAPNPVAEDETAPQEEPPEIGAYNIDNVVIQYFDITQNVAMIPVPFAQRTLMGLHLAVGAHEGPVVDLAIRLRDIGWPLGTLKGTSGAANVLNAVKAVSPDTVIIYRSLETPRGLVDCPDANIDPVIEAQRWVGGLQPYWAEVQADYYELMNECHPPAEWLLSFTLEAMRLASAQGQCLLVFSFAPGNPEPEYFAQLRPVFEYALANPCQPGRFHGIALHVYGIDRRTLLSDADPSVSLRHRIFYNTLLREIPESVNLPLYLTEAGAGDGATPFECEDVTRDVIRYTAQLERDPYVRGFHLWNVGQTTRFVDIAECIPMIRDALVAYYRVKPAAPEVVWYALE